MAIRHSNKRLALIQFLTDKKLPALTLLDERNGMFVKTTGDNALIS